MNNIVSESIQFRGRECLMRANNKKAGGQTTAF